MLYLHPTSMTFDPTASYIHCLLQILKTIITIIISDMAGAYPVRIDRGLGQDVTP